MTTPSQTTKQVQQISDSPTDWTQTLDFGQFDPSLGMLDAIEAGLSIDVTGSITIESLEAGPAVVAAALDSTVRVVSPGGELAKNEIDNSNSASFNAAGGSTTFSLGAAGASNPNTSNQLSNPSAFIGTGTVPLTVSESSYLEVTGPANMAITSRASAGAVVSMQYAYQNEGGGNATGGINEWMPTDEPVHLNLRTQNPVLQGVTTAAQTFTIADATSGWTDDVPVEQFNSNLGTLIAIDFTVTSDINASVSATNDDPVTSYIETVQTLSVSAGGFVSTSAWVGDLMKLASGASQTDEDLTKSNTTSGQVADASSLAAYTGSGTVDLPISSGSNAWLSGPGNLDATLLAKVGATVAVSYTYIPVVPNAPLDDPHPLIDPIPLGQPEGAPFTGNGLSFAGYDEQAGAGLWAAQGGSGSPMAGCYLAPSGNNTIVAGSLHDLIGFAKGAAGGANTIQDFLPGQDHIGLSGYGLGVVASVLQSASATAGGTTVTLPDGTSITVSGVNHVTASDFINS